MSDIYVVGFRHPDEKFLKMKAAFDACCNAGVDIPQAIKKYFEGQEPDSAGVTIDITEAVESWSDGDMMAGYQVDLSKLPQGVRFIRFYTEY